MTDEFQRLILLLYRANTAVGYVCMVFLFDAPKPGTISRTEIKKENGQHFVLLHEANCKERMSQLTLFCISVFHSRIGICVHDFFCA